jgi:hypothetical protein
MQYCSFLIITVNITSFDGALKEVTGFHDNSVCHLGLSRGKALGAFVQVTLASNGCYLILALALAKLVGTI